MATETVLLTPVEQLGPNPWAAEVGLPLSAEDEKSLRLSITTMGIQIPVVAWARGDRLVVLSGTYRLAIARELGHETVPAIVREFPDEHAAREFMLADNLARRHLTAGQRAWLGYQYQQLLAVGSGRRTDLQPSSNVSKVNARRTAAERAGVSEGAVADQGRRGERQRGPAPERPPRQDPAARRGHIREDRGQDSPPAPAARE